MNIFGAPYIYIYTNGSLDLSARNHRPGEFEMPGLNHQALICCEQVASKWPLSSYTFLHFVKVQFSDGVAKLTHAVMKQAARYDANIGSSQHPEK